MPETTNTSSHLLKFPEHLGRGVMRAIEEIGLGGALLMESLYWIVLGPHFKQPVRLHAIVRHMMEIGILALPIVLVLSSAIGVMLAIQGIYTLGLFGAESRVTIGIAFSMVREFAPLITGILIAGRSGSAMAARLGSMSINQEIDALRVMAINPVRYLVAPALIAMLVMLPCLTFSAMIVGLFAAGVYVNLELGLSLGAYAQETLNILRLDDLYHGLGKSLIFAILITIIGVINGASITGGAEGVGRMTTRAVVHSIAAIVITDMIFAFIVSR